MFYILSYTLNNMQIRAKKNFNEKWKSAESTKLNKRIPINTGHKNDTIWMVLRISNLCFSFQSGIQNKSRTMIRNGKCIFFLIWPCQTLCGHMLSVCVCVVFFHYMWKQVKSTLFEKGYIYRTQTNHASETSWIFFLMN